MGIGQPENTCQPTNIVDCFTHLSGDSPRVCSKKRKATCAPVLDRVSASFPPFYNVFPGIQQQSQPLFYNIGGSFMLVWVWNILVTYHDVTDLHIHGRLYEYMYVRLFEFMSTPLYVHVTHTQHTHSCTQNTHTTHQGFAHDCLGLYVCIC